MAIRKAQKGGAAKKAVKAGPRVGPGAVKKIVKVGNKVGIGAAKKAVKAKTKIKPKAKGKMIKKAQFGWIGNLTGSKYTMGPRINLEGKPKIAKKASTKAKAKALTAKKTEKKKAK